MAVKKEAFILAFSIVFLALAFSSHAEICVNPHEPSVYCRETTKELCCPSSAEYYNSSVTQDYCINNYYVIADNENCAIGCCYIPGKIVQNCQDNTVYKGLCSFYNGKFTTDETCQQLPECSQGCCCFTDSDSQKHSELTIKAVCSGSYNGAFFEDVLSSSGCSMQCSSLSGSSSESKTECSDNIDNDGDKLVDLADPDCLSSSDAYEGTSESQCDDGIDNDKDGFIDLDDSCCKMQNSVSESICSLPLCGSGEAAASCNCNGNEVCLSGQYCCNSGCLDIPCEDAKCVEGEKRLCIGQQTSDGCSYYQYCENGSFSQCQPDKNCVASFELCNNGIDDDKDGLIDCQEARCDNIICSDNYPAPSGRCLGKYYKYGSRSKCCVFGEPVDCDKDGFPDACGSCNCIDNPQKPVISLLEKADEQGWLRVEWFVNCPVDFVVYRCSGLSECLNSSNFKAIALVSGNSSFIDKSIKEDTRYCYYVTANYNGNLQKSEIKCYEPIDKACMNAPKHEICLDETKGLSGKKVLRARCSNNKVEVIDNCEISKGMDFYCIEEGDITRCAYQSKCERCGPPHNLFTDNNSATFNEDNFSILCSSLESCYLDYTKSSVDYFKDCSGVISCFDYHSKQACEGNNQRYNNKCLKYDCEWHSFNKSLSTGYCAPKNREIKCSDCNTAVFNRVFGGCSPEVCSSFGDCFLSNIRNSDNERLCMPSSELSCENYESQEDCTGNKPVVVDVRYSYGERVAGTNKILQKSHDALGIGLCKWNTESSSCFKDANNDNAKDIFPRDLLAPVSTILSPSAVKSLGFSVHVLDVGNMANSSSEISGVDKFYYCISDKKYCYPRTELQLDSSGKASVSLGYSAGTYMLYYYSVDNSGNLEPVKNKRITVDRTPPKISMSYQVVEDKSYPFDESSALIEIRLNENATCNDHLEGQQTNAIYNDNGSYFQASYTNLQDGFYFYNVNCTDMTGNTAEKLFIIRVDADKAVFDPEPYKLIDYKQIILKLKTKDSLNCEWERKGTNEHGSFSSEPITLAGKQAYQHTSSYIANSSGRYSFSVRCSSSSAQGFYDEIDFVYDVDSPKTSIVDGNGKEIDVSKWFSLEKIQNNIFFKCKDAPENGFGCAYTMYCLDDSKCEPSEAFDPRNPVVINLTSSRKKWLCYYSVENKFSGMGGKKESVNCIELKFDTRKPIIDVESLNSHTSPETALQLYNFSYLIKGSVVDPDTSNPSNLVNITVVSNSSVESYVNIAANEMFSQLILLRPGINKITIRAVDRAGQSVVKDYYIKALLFSESKITLEAPNKYGVSPKHPFDFVVAAHMPVEYCAYSFYPNTPIENMALFDTSWPESSSGKYFFKKSSFRICTSDIECSSEVFVKCKNIYNEIMSANFTLSYDSSSPHILKIMFSNTDAFDSSLISERPFRTNLTVVTDDLSHCRFSLSNADDFSSMQSFDSFDSLSRINIKSLDDSFLQDNKSYEFYVICENGAGLKTEKLKAMLNVDSSVSRKMRLLVPSSEYVMLSNFMFKLETNKKAGECSYGADSPTTKMSKISDTIFQSEMLNFSEGPYEYAFSCKFADGVAEKRFKFIVDSSVPSTPIVEDGNNSWFLSKLSANWSSEDNGSGIAMFEYAIGTSPGQADIFGYANTSSFSATVSGLNLTDKATYYWTVRSKDRAGHWSSYGYSNGVTVDLSFSPDYAKKASSCLNGINDGEESDIDCGGECSPCNDGSSCFTGDDCLSKVCVSGICQTAICSDNITNQDETDIDCGGLKCDPCGEGKHCIADSDCMLGLECVSGACRPEGYGMQDNESLDCLADGMKDSDCDGMPDSWEERYNLNVYADDSRDDPDNDGFSNADEYFNGTDPRIADKRGSSKWLFIFISLLVIAAVLGGYYYVSNYKPFSYSNGPFAKEPAQRSTRAEEKRRKQELYSYYLKKRREMLAKKEHEKELQRMLLKKKEEQKMMERERLLSKFDESEFIERPDIKGSTRKGSKNEYGSQGSQKGFTKETTIKESNKGKKGLLKAAKKKDNKAGLNTPKTKASLQKASKKDPFKELDKISKKIKNKKGKADSSDVFEKLDKISKKAKKSK